MQRRRNAGYAKVKEAARARNARLSRAGRDIGPPPPPADPARRAEAERSLQRFLELYFPHVFSLAWSPDHISVIGEIENAILHGGLSAIAMPRGSGKTSIVEAACLWAALYGHRGFILLIGSDAGHAEQMLESVKVELETNERLGDDFPEALGPIRALEGIANRCKGQHISGQRTYITWTAREIVLPTVRGSRASGAILKVAGLTASLRGMKFKRADGTSARPDFVILDDPQTDESAHSVTQCAGRERTIKGAVLGLAGPGKKLSGVMLATVIRSGDMADVFLDRGRNPDWHGRRTRMVYAWPTNKDLWERYAELRADSLRVGPGFEPATAFYADNRAQMDLGAAVAWPQRFDPDEISALQHAFNLRLKLGDEAFFSEYQNDPLQPSAAIEALDPVAIAKKLNGLARGTVPLAASHLVAFVDVQQDLLYYLVLGVAPNFTGDIVDYGAFPEQLGRGYWTLRDARPSLGDVFTGTTLEGRLYQGLLAATDKILGTVWKREGGGEAKVSRCMIDANWGASTDTVYQVCRQSQHAGQLLPSHGKFIGATQQPLSQWKDQKGERSGLEWRIRPGKRARTYCIYDANNWKSFAAERLRGTHGAAASIGLFGSDQAAHRMLCEHLTSETPTRVQAKGRTVDQWEAKPGRENHLWDCFVGACCLAAIEGASLTEAKSRGRRVKLSDMKRAK